MAYTDYLDTVQKYYIAFYQRPADSAGLLFWASKLNANGGDTSAMIEAFANSAEATALYGAINASTISATVTSLYSSLFGRTPDADGLAYYVNGFNAGTFTAATIMVNILNGATGEDAATVENKLDAANLFTQTLDPGLDGRDIQATYTDAAAGRDFLDGITWNVATIPTSTETVDFIKTNIATSTDPIQSNDIATTFTLTTNLDAPSAASPSVNTQGTSGNDTYKGVIGATTTLQDVDNIYGAGGTDTLEVLVTTATTGTANGAAQDNATVYTPVFLKAVEKVSVRDTTAATADGALFDTSSVTINLASAVGVTEVINDQSLETVTFQNIGTAAVTTQNIKTAGVGTTFTRGSAPVTADLTLNLDTLGSAAAAGNVAAVQAGAIASNDGNNDAVNVTVNAKGYVSVASLNVTGTGVAGTHTAQTVTIDAAGKTIFGAAGGAVDITGFDTTKAGKIVVKGAGEVELNTLAGAVKTVDASANTGGVTLVGTAYTGTEATAAAAPGLNITGGSGKDSISVDGVATAVVSAGDGDDTVTLTTTHAAGAKIDGGEGTDRIVLTSAMADALDAQTAAGTALRATLTGFEQIGIAAGADATQGLAAGFNVAQAGGYNYLALNGNVNDLGFVDGGAFDGARAADGSEDSLTDITVNGFTTGATVEFRLAGNQTDTLEIGMTGAAESSTDVVNLKLNADLAQGANHTVRAGVQGINNVNIDANDRVNSVLDDDQAAANAKDNTADDGYTLELSNAANVNNLKITGTSAVSYTLQTGTDAIKLIDASASTGNVTINVANFAGTERVEIKGSQGTNIITGDNAVFGEKITGGAKADTITGGAGADDMTGNGGRDAFIQNAGDSGTTAATIDQISDFGKVTVAATAAEVTAMTNQAAFQATATARGGDNADVINFAEDHNGGGTAGTGLTVASNISTFTTGVLAALEAVDGTSTEFTGKDISLNIAKGLLTLSGSDKAMVDTLAEWVAVANLAAETNAETLAFEFNGNTYVYQQTAAAESMVELTGTTGVTGVVLVGGAVAAAVGDIFIL